jgi:hypothetical protein
MDLSGFDPAVNGSRIDAGYHHGFVGDDHHRGLLFTLLTSRTSCGVVSIDGDNLVSLNKSLLSSPSLQRGFPSALATEGFVSEPPLSQWLC